MLYLLGPKSFRSFDTGAKSAWNALLGTERAAGASSEELGKLASQLGVTSEAQMQAKMKMDSLIASWNKGEISSEQLSQEMKELGGATDEVGDDLFSLENIVKGAGAALSVDLAKQAAKAIYELGELGAQSLRTKAAFDAISGGANVASENLAAMKAATRGAMSESELMASANRLMQMGLASNADELARVTQMATRLGGAMGTGATASIENFAMMLANQSLPRLDTFGISSGKVRARIAELQAQTEGLSHETAFMTAVMEQGEAAMARLGNSAGDELLAFEQLEATITNLKTTVAEKAAPAVSQFAGTLNLLLTWNDRLAEATTQHADEVRNTAESYEEYRARMEQIAMAQGAVIDAEGNLVKKHQEIRAATGMVRGETTEMVKANFALSEATWGVIKAEEAGIPIVDGWMTSMQATQETTEESTIQLISAEDAVKLFTLTLEDSNLAAESAAWNQELLAEALGITTTAEQQAQLDAQLLSEAYQAGAMSAGEYRDRLVGVAQGTASLSEAEREAINSEIASAEATQKLTEAHNQAAIAAAGQAKETMVLAGSLKNATSTEIAQQMIGMLDPEKMGAEAYSTAVKDIGLSFGTMDEESIALSENIDGLATMIQEGIVPVESAAEALSTLIEDARDGQVDLEALQEKFAALPQPVEQSRTSMNLSRTSMGQLRIEENLLTTTTAQTGAATDGYVHSLDTLNEGAIRTRKNLVALNDAIEKYNKLSGGRGGGDGSGGGRQHGGPVRAGQSYIVGERRPELFVPATDGLILPSVPGGMAAGQGKMVVVMPVILQMEDYMKSGELDYRALARAMVE